MAEVRMRPTKLVERNCGENGNGKPYLFFYFFFLTMETGERVEQTPVASRDLRLCTGINAPRKVLFALPIKMG